MDMKIVCCILSVMVMVSCLHGAPLDEQLPDTTGLFFGKRNSHYGYGRRSYSVADQLPDTTGLFFGKRNHPNMNGLLFGKRNSLELDAEDARQVCKAVQVACQKWGDN